METIEKISIRCFFIGIAFITIWFLCLITGNWMFKIHSAWFNLNTSEFCTINYAGLMFAKVCIVIFFLIPWIACKICGKKH